MGHWHMKVKTFTIKPFYNRSENKQEYHVYGKKGNYYGFFDTIQDAVTFCNITIDRAIK